MTVGGCGGAAEGVIKPAEAGTSGSIRRSIWHWEHGKRLALPALPGQLRPHPAGLHRAGAGAPTGQEPARAEPGGDGAGKGLGSGVWGGQSPQQPPCGSGAPWGAHAPIAPVWGLVLAMPGRWGGGDQDLATGFLLLLLSTWGGGSSKQLPQGQWGHPMARRNL